MQEAVRHTPANPEPFWTPKVWSGMSVSTWLGLLAENRFAIHGTRWAMAAILTGLSVSNSVLGRVQRLLYGRRIANTQLAAPPLFVLGHWRSGTTLLHELLACDPRHAFPTTYECFAPHHALLTAPLMHVLRFLLPKRRLQDDMALGLERPQEDEFALANLGVGSPYRAFAFPNHASRDADWLELDDLPAAERARWERTLSRFLATVTCRAPRRLVLKSPTHTARLTTLARLFPDARFVYMVRDPFAVFASTVKLLKVLQRTQGLQRPTYAGLEEQVFRTFERLHAAVERGRDIVPTEQFCVVRYEDLIVDPLGEMERVYEHLELGPFEVAEPGIRAYLDSTRDYRTNRYELSDELRERISERWSEFFEQFGYERSQTRRASVVVG